MALNLTDIVALAKAGYKPNDVKELISLSADSEKPKEEKPSETLAEGQAEVTEPEKATEQPEKASKEPEEVLQYKQQIEELNKKLQEAQQANVSKDVAPANVKSDFDTCVDLMTSFL